MCNLLPCSYCSNGFYLKISRQNLDFMFTLGYAEVWLMQQFGLQFVLHFLVLLSSHCGVRSLTTSAKIQIIVVYQFRGVLSCSDQLFVTNSSRISCRGACLMAQVRVPLEDQTSGKYVPSIYKITLITLHGLDLRILPK